MNTGDQKALCKILDNAFETLAAYNGLVEGFGWTYPIGRLADSQHRQVKDLLQVFWHLGIPAVKNTHSDEVKVAVALKPSLLSCITLEKAKVDLCSRYSKTSDHILSKRIISEIRTKSNSAHLNALYNFAQGATDKEKIYHFPVQWRPGRPLIDIKAVAITEPADHYEFAAAHC